MRQSKRQRFSDVDFGIAAQCPDESCKKYWHLNDGTPISNGFQSSIMIHNTLFYCSVKQGEDTLPIFCVKTIFEGRTYLAEAKNSTAAWEKVRNILHQENILTNWKGAISGPHLFGFRDVGILPSPIIGIM